METYKYIHKYILKIGELNLFEIPAAAKPVSIGIDPAGGMIAMWVEFEPRWPNEFRRFSVHGTGHPIPSDRQYVGSVIDGRFVWHVYELPK